MASADEGLYEVELILDVRTVGNVNEYLVRWVNFTTEHDSWEPEENLHDCHDLVESFLRNRRASENAQNTQENKNDDDNTNDKNTVEQNIEFAASSSSSVAHDSSKITTSPSSTTPAQISQNGSSIGSPSTSDNYNDEEQTGVKRKAGTARNGMRKKKTKIDYESSTMDTKTTATTMAEDELVAKVINDVISKPLGMSSRKVVSSEKVTPPSIKKKRSHTKRRPYWEMVPSTTNTLKDPFWKNLENGNVDLSDSGGLYERVKRGRNLASTMTKKQLRQRRRLAKSKRRVVIDDDDDDEEEKSMKEESTKLDEEKSGEDGDDEGDRPETAVEENDSTDSVDEREQHQETDVSSPIDSNQKYEPSENDALSTDQTEDGDRYIIVDQTTEEKATTENMEEADFDDSPIDDEEIPTEPLANEPTVEQHDASPDSTVSDSIDATVDSVVKESSMQPTIEVEHQQQQQISPTSKSPGGQWRAMKPPASAQTTEAAAKIGEKQSWMPSLHSDEAAVAEDVGLPGPSSSAFDHQADFEDESAPYEVPIPGFPVPIFHNLSLSDFFKDEMRQRSLEMDAFQPITSFGAFESACCNGDVDIVRHALATRKSNPAIEVNGRNALTGNPILMQVCSLGCDPAHKLDDIIDLLVSNGANLNSRNEAGDTALTMAININQICKVTKLLSRGAAINLPNRDGETPLMVASKRNLATIVFRLIEYGADFNAQSASGKTAADFAADASKSLGMTGVCETGLRERSAKIIKAFDRAFRVVVSTEKFEIIDQLFPMHCYALNESHAFRIVFAMKNDPEPPSNQFSYILALAKARYMSVQQIDVKFCGNTPVTKVVLNEVEQLPATEIGKFLYALWPLKKGLNDLVITCVPDCKESHCKLLTHAYALRILGNQ